MLYGHLIIFKKYGFFIRTTTINSIPFFAHVIKNDDRLDIKWERIQDDLNKKENAISNEQCTKDLLCLFFNKLSQKEECNVKNFNLGIKAYLNNDNKICILEIPKNSLLNPFIKFDNPEFDFSLLSLETHYDKSVDALLIHILSPFNLPKNIYGHTIYPLDDDYGSDILFHTDNMNNIYSIEVLFASEFLNLNFEKS